MKTGTILGPNIIKVNFDFSTATDTSAQTKTINGNWAVVIGSRATNKYGTVYSNHKGELYNVSANRTTSGTTTLAVAPNGNHYYGGYAACQVYLTRG